MQNGGSTICTFFAMWQQDCSCLFVPTFKLTTEAWQIRAENRGGDADKGLLLGVKRAWIQIPPFAHFLLTNFVSIIWKFSVGHQDRILLVPFYFQRYCTKNPCRKKILSKHEIFVLQGLFRAPDLKTNTLPANFRSNSRRTVFR